MTILITNDFCRGGAKTGGGEGFEPAVMNIILLQ
jgi:hypothetical protein